MHVRNTGTVRLTVADWLERAAGTGKGPSPSSARRGVTRRVVPRVRIARLSTASITYGALATSESYIALLERS